MQLSINNTYMTFTGLVPFDKYKGPILNLTKDEKIAIEKIQKEIKDIEFELINLYKICKNLKKYTKGTEYYENRIYEKELKLEILQEQIKDIKINRLNIQKSNTHIS